MRRGGWARALIPTHDPEGRLVPAQRLFNAWGGVLRQPLPAVGAVGEADPFAPQRRVRLRSGGPEPAAEPRSLTSGHASQVRQRFAVRESHGRDQELPRFAVWRASHVPRHSVSMTRRLSDETSPFLSLFLAVPAFFVYLTSRVMYHQP